MEWDHNALNLNFFIFICDTNFLKKRFAETIFRFSILDIYKCPEKCPIQATFIILWFDRLLDFSKSKSWKIMRFNIQPLKRLWQKANLYNPLIWSIQFGIAFWRNLFKGCIVRFFKIKVLKNYEFQYTTFKKVSALLVHYI